jgi:mono/diheme cytochrome c family protein
MQAPQTQKPLLPAVLFDASLDDDVDHVLALAMLFGLEGRRQVRVGSLSTSRFNLRIARFLDLVARFYAGDRPGAVVSRNPPPIGMSTAGTQIDRVSPMLDAALLRTGADGQPAYLGTLQGLNDTADPVALIRNSLSAQVDRNAAVVLAGPPTNLVALTRIPEARAWAASKASVLAIAAGRFDGNTPDPVVSADVAGFRKLLADWPAPIVMAGAELSDALPFPGASLDTGFTWAPHHPVVDAYRAFRTMPYDAPSRALAAVLHAASPAERYFDLSEPGTITVADDGRTRFTPSPAGPHRYLIARPERKARVLEAYVQLVSAQPPPRPGRGGRPAAAAGAALTLIGASLAAVLAVGMTEPLSGQSDDFAATVRPVLTGTCAQCHNSRMLAGGMSVEAMASPESLVQQRELWEKVLRRLRAGDMPPAGAPRPAQAQLDAMTGYIERAFDRADAAIPQDPGRITARRLNRSEYANTIRDLLGVQFRAEKYFPADDSGDGFDNIGDVLTVSPLLTERYLAAADRIARWAISTEIPAKPIEADYRARDRRIRRVDRSTIEAEHRVEFAGAYTVRIGLPGERPPVNGKDAAPVTLGLWMNGALIATKTVETKPSGLVYFDPYSEEELRVQLSEGDHVFRAGFIDDGFVKTLPAAESYDRRKNKFLDSMVFVGPFAPAAEKESRRKILSCNPASGRRCVERIVTDLATRAYRRPATGREVEALMRFVQLGSRGRSAEHGLQLAIQAMLMSPNFLFRVERDRNPRDPRDVHDVSPFELASRLSYFLWSSMPDDELMDLAASGRLRDRPVLDAQVVRMLADPRARAFAENFAGQWLETRNLDIVKPDPDTFKEWDAELRDAMKRETALFFEHVLRENRPVSDFLTADYTFLNERLATHYAIAGVTGAEMRRVPLQTDRRGGVLGQGAVLTVSSYPTRTSPVIRGKYVLQNILGTPPEPPPGDIPPLEDAGAGAGRSAREQLERHRNNPACAACHRNMDPLGFGLENYDAIGRWRDLDGKFPVDASGTLPDGRKFSTPGEMRSLLASHLPQFSRTLTEKMMTYALGRGLKAFDRRVVDAVQRAVAADGYRFQTMVREVVHSVPFRARRGEGERREEAPGVR